MLIFVYVLVYTLFAIFFPNLFWTTSKEVFLYIIGFVIVFVFFETWVSRKFVKKVLKERYFLSQFTQTCTYFLPLIEDKIVFLIDGENRVIKIKKQDIFPVRDGQKPMLMRYEYDLSGIWRFIFMPDLRSEYEAFLPEHDASFFNKEKTV